RVSISVENASLDEVLHQILKNTSLSYRRMSGSLVVITAETANSFITITGKVTDERGEPLAGVNIIEKGTSNGTTTRDDGVFILNTENANATLVFTYIGFTLQEVDLAGRTTINVQLKPSNKSLQEVIVVGYGQQRKSLVTGAISSVKADQLTTVSSTRIDQALQGRTAGVVILPTSGQPGAGLNIGIRGAGSNRNSNPLFI